MGAGMKRAARKTVSLAARAVSLAAETINNDNPTTISIPDAEEEDEEKEEESECEQEEEEVEDDEEEEDTVVEEQGENGQGGVKDKVVDTTGAGKAEDTTTAADAKPADQATNVGAGGDKAKAEDEKKKAAKAEEEKVKAEARAFALSNTSGIPQFWPASAKSRIKELEGFLYHAPPVDALRAAMVVGFALMHSNHLTTDQAKVEFHKSLVDYLRLKHLTTIGMPTFRPPGLNIEPQIWTLMGNIHHRSSVLEQQQQQYRSQQDMQMRYQQQQQLHQQYVSINQRKQQLLAARPAMQQQKSATTTTPPPRAKRARRVDSGFSKTIYQGPAKPVDGIDHDLTGWTMRIVARGTYKDESGNEVRRKGPRNDNYWYTPIHKEVLRSRKEVNRYFDLYNDPKSGFYKDERGAALEAKYRRQSVDDTPTPTSNKLTPMATAQTPTATNQQPLPGTKPTPAAAKTPTATNQQPVAATYHTTTPSIETIAKQLVSGARGNNEKSQLAKQATAECDRVREKIRAAWEKKPPPTADQAATATPKPQDPPQGTNTQAGEEGGRSPNHSDIETSLEDGEGEII